MTIKSHLNHIQIYVSDKKRSFDFYKKLLIYLGYKIIEENNSLGMRNGKSDIWFKEFPKDGKKNYNRRNVGINHIAFGVSDKKYINKFMKEFLIPNKIKTLYGSPRKFPEYTKDYYAVYFEDPDKIKLEVMYL